MEEVIHEGEFTRVVRLLRVTGSVIAKEPRGPGAARRLRHEQAILERLAGVGGVPQLLREPHRPGALMLEDTGSVDLTQIWPSHPLVGAELIGFATRLARIVAGVHRSGVVHKDINPTNIVVSQDGEHREPTLIDFHVATTFAEDRPGFTPATEIAGTLAYIAPEQTGRTGRRVDQRSDLYALGATLYELATGRPPFGSGDAFQLIHDHLALVPVPPAEYGVSAGLSDIIARLLEKDPDLRYQSADGLVHDLNLLAAREAAGDPRPLVLGEHDFPPRLSAPSRLVGREREIELLARAFAGATEGTVRGLLISGAPGVGKSALIDDLRPLVAGSGGWMVKGKFDQYRRDTRADGVWQATRALCRLLLAEPEERLVEERARIRAAVGHNAGLLGAILPEFATLLQLDPAELPDTADVHDRRLNQAGLDLVRAVVSIGRPLVIVLDDVQWAGLTPLGLIDTLLSDSDLRGLLLIGAYREVDLTATHPLPAMMARWDRLEPSLVRMSLHNLPDQDVALLLHEMLRLPPDAAGDLAQVVAERTRGNPYDTVELLNALRRDGALVLRDGAWTWDAGTLRRYIGYGDVVSLLTARIDSLPAPSAALLEVMACLGGEVELSLLEAATGEPLPVIDPWLAAPLEDGLLTVGRDSDFSMRFRHDRVQQAAYSRIDAARRQTLQLTLARRLAAHEEFSAVAADQYLASVGALADPDEIRRVAALFRQAALAVRPTNATLSERLLATGVELLKRHETPEDGPLLLALETKWHTMLYHLGRGAEGDAVYESIKRRTDDPLVLAGPVIVQVNSLQDRGGQREGFDLGLRMLRRLGLDAPDGDVAPPTEAEWAALYEWIEHVNLEAELRRPPVTDPRVLAVARVIGGLSTPAYYINARIHAWLVLTSQRLWAEYGPALTLISTMSYIPAVTVGLRRDYRTGYLAARHTLAVSEARGYEPATSYNRSCFALFAQHWFEPLEGTLETARLAREGLLKARHVQGACYTYNTTLSSMLDCAPSIDALDDDVETAMQLAIATHNVHSQASFVVQRQVVRALRGLTKGPGAFADDDFDDADYLAGAGGHPIGASIYHANRAITAAIFGDWDTLHEHTTAAIPLVSRQGAYRAGLGFTLHGLSCAIRARERPGEFNELMDGARRCRDWLAERAADAPENFLHLCRLVEAEMAWSLGDRPTAAATFDAALCDLENRARPWHTALITERMAEFEFAGGLDHIGRGLLLEARRCYEAWGASAKVTELDRRHPFLRGHITEESARPSTGRVSADVIDMAAVLEAARALSSQRGLHELRVRVAETLGALTGATSVQVVLRDDEANDWVLPADSDDAKALTVDDAAARGLLPVSAFRYAERTREPLVVDDTTRDHRFSRDPYLVGLGSCSLLLVPILNQGEPLAMLLLENRLSRGAFSADRLDAVTLIAGQLGVSFSNARINDTLGRLVDERTKELAAAKDRLEVLSRTDALTGLANRRLLVDVLEAELLVSTRTGMPTGVMMIDIDHFKRYNDRYGHIAGDECLRRVATALSQNIRTTDIIARYGGEEFAVIMPRTGLPEAYGIAERARAAVAALMEPHDWSPRGHVTVSIGLASESATPDTTAEWILESADTQLYEAKRHGRDQVRAAAIVR